MCVERLELRVHVHTPVDRIGKAVHADTVYLVLALRLDVEPVLAARQPAQHEAGAVESV